EPGGGVPGPYGDNGARRGARLRPRHGRGDADPGAGGHGPRPAGQGAGLRGRRRQL
ncbi:MAG: hypothetical protein AVDCRST_MAG02-3041, partial [uncultured Rubrobacteraceae bacterium]